jgi:hypothetical protein
MVSITVITPKSLIKQVAFAVSGALNDTAFAIRAELVAALPEHFTVRRPYTANQMRVGKRATRSRPVVEVGSPLRYVTDQSIGATHTGTAVPSRGLRRSPRSVISKRSWPRARIDKPNHFLIDARTKGPLVARSPGVRLVARRGRGRSRRIKIIWALPESQRIKPRFPFRAIAEKHAERAFNAAFPGRLRAALETAR